MIQFGTTAISTVRFGATPVDKIMLGPSLVWQSASPWGATGGAWSTYYGTGGGSSEGDKFVLSGSSTTAQAYIIVAISGFVNSSIYYLNGADNDNYLNLVRNSSPAPYLQGGYGAGYISEINYSGNYSHTDTDKMAIEAGNAVVLSFDLTMSFSGLRIWWSAT